jgi:hypothetical protein
MTRLLAAVLLVVVSFLEASPSRSADSVYSLDGVDLGSNISDLIASRGKSQTTPLGTYRWTNSAGTTLAVDTAADGTILVIDVRAGKDDHDEVTLPAEPPQTSVVFAETSHMNYNPPRGSTFVDDCGPGLTGMPCWVTTLPGNVDLVTNFGKDNGTFDGFLSEVILGHRDTLIGIGRVVRRPAS